MALFLVGSTVLSLTQMTIVYTLQKSLMMMTVYIVKYGSNKEDSFLTQTDLNFLVTCILLDYINFNSVKYKVMHLGTWQAGHAYKMEINNQEPR